MKNMGAPLSTAQIACKTWILGLQTLANVSHRRHRNHLRVLHDHCAALNVSGHVFLCLEKHHGRTQRSKGNSEERTTEPRGHSSPSSAFPLRAQNCSGLMEQGGGSARGRWSYQQEEHTRSLRKKSLFVQISLAPLTTPSLFTGKAMGAPTN